MVGESARNQLYNRLSEVLGAESAEVLMSHLPPIPIGDLATRADVAGLRGELKSDLAGLRGELKADISRLDRGLADLSLRFDTMNQRIDRMFITQILGLVTVVGAIFASNAIF